MATRVKTFVLALLVALPASVYGADPLFRHKDKLADQEFENVYQDLRSKANAADYLPLSGGTMTGDINGLQAADTAGQPIRYEQLYLSEWTTYTATGGWTSNVTYTAKWRRVGDTMEVQFKIACSGAPDNVTPSIIIPVTNAMDTAKLVDAVADQTYLGRALAVDAGNGLYVIDILFNSATEVKFRSHDVVGSDILLGQMNSNTLPFAFGNGDYITGSFRVPISGWTAK